MLQTPHSAIDVSTIPLLQDSQTTDEQAHEPPQSQPEENPNFIQQVQDINQTV